MARAVNPPTFSVSALPVRRRDPEPPNPTDVTDVTGDLVALTGEVRSLVARIAIARRAVADLVVAYEAVTEAHQDCAAHRDDEVPAKPAGPNDLSPEKS